MANIKLTLYSNENDIKLISSKVLRYFEYFTLEYILKEKKIIVNNKWTYEIMISMGKNNFDYIEQPGYRNFPSEGRKLYVAFVPNSYINTKTSALKIADIVYECICVFLLNNFKKIDRSYLNAKKELLDMKYLQSIPFPAPEEEVEYMGMPLKEYIDSILYYEPEKD